MRLAALARRLAERAAASEVLAADSSAFRVRYVVDDALPDQAASPSASLYGSVAYWNSRYAAAAAPAEEESSRDEWYVGTPPVLALLQAHASAVGACVGVLGCGLSALPAALAAAGYARVCAVDASEVAIRSLSYEVGDVRRLAWPSGSMDALVDKATLDTLLNGGELDAAALLSEAARVLRPGGVLLSISTGTPEERLPLLLAPRAAEAAQCGSETVTDVVQAAEAAPCFELAQHAELRRGVHTFHVYVLRRL